MFNFRDKTVNVAGICRENECDKTDKNLLYIIRSFNYLWKKKLDTNILVGQYFH